MAAPDETITAHQELLSTLEGIFPWIHDPEDDEADDEWFMWRYGGSKPIPLAQRLLRGSWHLDSLIFKPMKGFQLGYLDLGGRHLQRYHEALTAYIELVKLYVQPEMSSLVQRYNSGEEDLHDQIPQWCTDLEQYNHVYDSIREVQESLTARLPVYLQKLTLSDLPVDVLHLILEHCDVHSARCLRFMSRAFAVLCRPYAFQEFVLEWPFPMGGTAKRFARSCRKFVGKCDMLFQDQSVICNIRNLGLSLLPLPGLPPVDLYTGDWRSCARSLLKPFSLHLSAILLQGHHIENLTLTCLHLDNTFMGRIFTLPHLRTLNISLCDMTIDDPPPASVKSTSVLNLSIATSSLDDTRDLDANEFFLGIPSLRYLTHDGSLTSTHILVDTDGAYVASDAAAYALSFLERLEIVNVFGDELSLLPRWFAESCLWTEDDRLRLTHFRLTSRAGMPAMAYIPIIDVLFGSPLRCLRLEGLSDIDHDIFTVLAHTFPELEDLTLMYMPSGRRGSYEPATWPHLAEHYAPQFAHFAKLKSLTWNYRIERLYTHSNVILAFEEGWDPDGDDFFDMKYFEPVPWFSDWISIFRLFAAYCPSLETLDFTHRAILNRGTGRVVDVEAYSLSGHSFDDPTRPWQSPLPMF